ncbi:MAG: hypothetical protein U0271_14950 [Polyangiaceae bacterium]
MKIGFALAAVVLGAFGATTVASNLVSADDGKDLESKMGVTASFDAKSKKVTIVLKGKESGVYVNTEYPFSCTLNGKDGGSVDKAKVTKDDAKLEDSGHAGKAKSATFSVGADKGVTGECKLVACSESACSSPFKVPFSSN